MSLNTLNTAYANGETIDASHPNEITLALLSQFVGRNSSGIPTSGQSLGTLALPWGNIYGSGLILDGTALDTSLITSSPNRIVSGKTRTLSSLPDFIRANGAALSFQVLGATTNLVLSVNNEAATVTTDITKTGVTAAPSSNNTCLVNDANMTNDKYAGEDGTTITIDTVGTEISGKVGQVCAFRNGATTDYFLGFVKSATEITDVFRGFFFDSSGNPLVRANLSNNDTLTIMSLGWVFIEDNGTTVDISYKTPVYAYTSPTSPATGDYWYDLSSQVWKRYSGVSFEVIDRILVGMVVADATNCIASRCLDFDKTFKNTNEVNLSVFSTEIIRSKEIASNINVYGTDVLIKNTKFGWNITTDLESGLTEAASTTYYLYMAVTGQTILSTEKPYYRPNLLGYYHPYHSWRCIGNAYNNSGSNLVQTCAFPYNPNLKQPIAYIKDVKAAATDGGGITSGSFVTRDLNTLADDEAIIIALSANQFTLPVGKWQVEALMPGRGINRFAGKMRNITDSTDTILGNSAEAAAASEHTVLCAISGKFTLTTPKVFEIQMRAETTRATTGLGRAGNLGITELYTIVKITKIG